MRDYPKLRGQDADDARMIAYRISAPLHHCVGTKQCQDPTRCAMCMNAGRLAVQEYRKVVERRVVNKIVSDYDAGCSMPHPGSD